MKAVEIIDWLNERIPPNIAENWDNTGLQIGNTSKEVKKLGVCFQADLNTIKKAVKAETDFLITHHPVLSPNHNPLKNIINADYEIFRLLINNNITVFSCHTNWDKAKIEKAWDVALIDHAPPERRIKEIKRLANLVKYIVIHDSNGRYDRSYHYSRIYPLFKYQVDFNHAHPSTTVLSNLVSLKKLS